MLLNIFVFFSGLLIPQAFASTKYVIISTYNVSKCQGPVEASATFIAGECKTFQQLCKENLVDQSSCQDPRFSDSSLKYSCQDSEIIRYSYKTSKCDSEPQQITYRSPLCQDKREIRCESRFPSESKLISTTTSNAWSFMYPRLLELAVAAAGIALILY